MRRFALLVVSTVLLACTPIEEADKLMGWPDLTSRPLPAPTDTVHYREGEAGVVDVWLPEGEGPHPVVLMIHGGCWQKSIADRTLMNYAAEDLRQRGFAVWNIEYRGVDEDGGGYPGTFTDVAAAADALSAYAEKYDLDMSRVAAFGHSAGGHLAVWNSARSNLPDDSALAGGKPYPLLGVVNSGGLADLEASSPVTLPSCLSEIEDSLTGRDEGRTDPYRDTSPVYLLPMEAEQISVNAADDRIAPPLLGQAFTDKVRDAGGTAHFVEVRGGHVELIAPGTSAFERQADILEEILNQQR